MHRHRDEVPLEWCKPNCNYCFVGTSTETCYCHKGLHPATGRRGPSDLSPSGLHSLLTEEDLQLFNSLTSHPVPGPSSDTAAREGVPTHPEAQHQNPTPGNSGFS